MSIAATAGVPFHADCSGAFVGDLPSGLVGTITVGVYDAPLPGGMVVVAPTTVGITELAGPVYAAMLTVPGALEGGVVRWVASIGVAEELLNVLPPPAVGAAGAVVVSAVRPTPVFEGTAVTVEMLFTLPNPLNASDAPPADPSTVTMQFRTGRNGAWTTWVFGADDQLVHGGVGRFMATIPLTRGQAIVKVVGTGACVASGVLRFPVLGLP